MPITVTHAKSVTIADWAGVVTVANSTGGTATDQASNLARGTDWNSGHANTFQITGSEIASLFNFGNGLSSTTAAGGITAGISSIGYFEPFIPANTNSSLSAPGIGTWYFDPVIIPFALGSGQIRQLMACAAGFKNGRVYSATSSGSWSRVFTLNNILALYRLGTGADTTRIESIWSGDCSFLATWSGQQNAVSSSRLTVSNALTVSIPSQWDASGGVTYGTTSRSTTTAVSATTGASTLADNAITTAVAFVSGSYMAVHGFATSIPAGLYWLGHAMSSSQAYSGATYTTGTGFTTQSKIAMLEFVGQGYKRAGLSVSDSSSVFEQFHGSYATTSSAPPATVGTANIRNLATNHRLYWNYAQTSA